MNIHYGAALDIAMLEITKTSAGIWISSMDDSTSFLYYAVTKK